MAKRRSRRKSVHLAKAPPSAKFLAQGPNENAIRRARIAAAGEAIARGGEWPTLARVEKQDRKIAPATLGRNSDALDPARRIWMAAAATAMTTAGEFPTLTAIRDRAGAVRLGVLAKYEDALTEERRRWVAEHGAHPDWIDSSDRPEQAGEIDAERTAPREGVTGKGREVDGTSPAGGATVDTTLLEKRIARLAAERKKDRETIANLTVELAEAREALRRALLPVLKEHAAFIDSAPTPKSTARGRTRPQPKAPPPR